MRMLLFYILLVAFGCQQTPFLESENLKNSESEKGCEQRAMSNETFFESENLKTSESEKGCEPRAMSHEPFLESEKSVNISEICGNKKTNHKLAQKESEKGCEPRAMSHEPFLESEKSVNISEICGNKKTNHKLAQKESEKGSEPRAMSNEQKSPNAQSSQLEAQSLKKTVDYFENQIRLADSLYKNYLPQYNFEEVKAAVMFFDSCEQRAMSNETFFETEKSVNISEICGNEKTNHKLVQKKSEKVCEQQTTSNEQRFRKAQSSQHEAQSLKKTVDCCPLTVDIEYQRARAHYYHAVGLTERDDIVGACEHYLCALEIMEPLVETSPLWRLMTNNKGQMANGERLKSQGCNAHSSKLEVQSPDYEKIWFLSLIYTRLGELFYSENYCNLAISKYRKALKYKLLLGENKAVANTYKCLGNSYQLYDMPDSALYYYNKSLETNSELPNRLDVEKCIAHILFDRGEKDSAYVLLKNNLREIDNGNLKYSYYCTLGNMYFNDKKYDSALYYLETSLDNDIVTKKVAFTTKLSAIYDSLSDYDKRDYYDNFSAKMLLNNANKEVYNKQLQVLYDNYKERKNEREKSIAKVRTRKLIIAISLGVFVIVAFLLTYIKYMHRKQNNKLKSEIDDYVNKIDNYSKDIENQNIIINQKEKLINDYQITNDKKDKIIDKQKKEIDRIRTRLSKKNVNIEAYYASDICKKIVERKDSDFSCLKEDELALLLKSADEHLDNISERLHNSFLRLNKNDIYTICLLILNVKKSKLQYLLGKDRKTIWNRLNKIKRLMNVDENHDLFLYIKDNFLN